MREGYTCYTCPLIYILLVYPPLWYTPSIPLEGTWDQAYPQSYLEPDIPRMGPGTRGPSDPRENCDRRYRKEKEQVLDRQKFISAVGTFQSVFDVDVQLPKQHCN